MGVRRADGYATEAAEKDADGTDILLKIKENTAEERFDAFLDEYRLKAIIKRYFDFSRYPIQMDGTRNRLYVKRQ